MITSLAVAALVLLPVSLGAQWLDLRTPGIPRTADGKPNLKAPTPKMPDGTPDLSGLWLPENNEYSGNLIQDVKDEAIFRPDAEALFRKRVADFSISPHVRCLPEGPHQIFGTGGPDHSLYRIIQSPNFTDRSWLDEAGHPHSEDLHITERFRRIDFGHMQFQITFDDPKTLTRPLTLSLTINYAPDTEMLEYVCNESERDNVHFVGGKEGATVRAEVLQTYAGTYQAKDGGNVTVRLADGQLYLGAIPLIATSNTRFESADSNIEFVVGADGVVTHLLRIAVEGDLRYDRK